MSDVSYPVPIRYVITGDKKWGDCHLSRLFRKSRLSLVPDPPITGFLPLLENVEPVYSKDINALHKKFKQAKESGWSALYLYSKVSINDPQPDLFDSIYYRACPDYWTPEQIQHHYDLLDSDHIHQTLIALDLHADFDQQIRNSAISPESFNDWRELQQTPINGVRDKALYATAYKRQKTQPQPQTERRFKVVWTNPKADQLPLPTRKTELLPIL